MGRMSLGSLIYRLTMLQGYIAYTTMDKTEQKVVLNAIEEIIEALKGE